MHPLYLCSLVILSVVLLIVVICSLRNNNEIVKSEEALAVTTNKELPVLPLDLPDLEPQNTIKKRYNLSAMKTDDGFFGVIRSEQSRYGANFSLPEIVKINNDGIIKSLQPVNLDVSELKYCSERRYNVRANGVEDPKLFIYQGENWVIANVLGSKEQYHPCINTMCIFKLEDAKNTFKILTPPFDNTRQQKNWQPFEWKNNGQSKLLCEYQLDPHIIFEIDIDTGNCTELARTFRENENSNNVKSKKSLRGGAPPIYIPEEDIYIGVGHSNHSDYLHFFYSFESKYPFRILNVSKMFKLENDELIQFVAGFSRHTDDNFYLTYGVADKDNRISKFSYSTVISMLTPE